MNEQTKQRVIEKACVIGAGVMGSGIAAHLANAGVQVLLLDIVPKDNPSGDPNILAKKGKEKAFTAKPMQFFSKDAANLVQVGNLQDDLVKAAEFDWIIEAVSENLSIKQSLYAKLEPILGFNTIISSNTSGLSVASLIEGRSEGFKERFMVTHFFNPVRYLHLLEIIPTVKTTPAHVERIAQFAESKLGKGVVYAKDTPNFVANRIGVFGMMKTIQYMMEGNYSIEEVDAVFGPALGRPKSAVFRTADVVGLDTFSYVTKNCYDNLTPPERDIFKMPDFMNQMIEKGWLGEKTKQGFYRKNDGVIEALDYKTMTYHAKQKVRIESLGKIRNIESLDERIKTVFYANDRAGELCFAITSAVLLYAAKLVGEIADDIVQIDRAMRWGFGWEKGPFETFDAIGVREACAMMTKKGMVLPAFLESFLQSGKETFYSYDGAKKSYFNGNSYSVIKDEAAHLSLPFLKLNKNNIVHDSFATSLIDMGDGVLLCEFHTKMNAIDADVLKDVNTALDMCEEGKFGALVLHNEGQNFSVGANLFLIYMGAMQQEWKQIEEMVKKFQDLGLRLKYSPIPTVAAPFQMTLGGGAELSMWCNKIRAHAETYFGLVEAGVGLIPGGGGNIELLARNLYGMIDDPQFHPEPFIRRAVETVAMAKVSSGAENARELRYFAKGDCITMNRRHMLEAAKADALAMMRGGFTPPRQRMFRLPGKSAYEAFNVVLGSMHEGELISEHDLKIALKVAQVMTGADCSTRVPVSEQYLLDLECEAFLSLCGEVKTQERISYMLEHGKPLRN